ncbi:hypothetical protein [Microvirga sp. Mcv34]|uniref:hypothetical protein n=1 Tax=Microvirga sp. Mcv34 TaxID=2926016 RepID=UPI0021C819EE|nr:hypothetical protein [Microvirga sp. Mcv34]
MPARKQAYSPNPEEIEILRSLANPSKISGADKLPKSPTRDRLVRHGLIESEKLPPMSGAIGGGAQKAWKLTAYGRQILAQHGKAAA